MKVIAIVNLPFDADLNKEDAYFVMRDGKYCQKVSLRPLPKKKTEEEEMAKDPFNEDLFYDEYIWGWNACLKEITGETE